MTKPVYGFRPVGDHGSARKGVQPQLPRAAISLRQMLKLVLA